MKKFFETLLLVAFTTVLVIFGACKRSSRTTSQTAAAPAQPTTEQQYNHPEGGPAAPAAQTKFFKGSIGSTLGLQMKLVRSGDNLSGSYFYQKVGTKIDLKGTVDKQGNTMLEEFDPSGKSTGVFKGFWKTDEDGLINIAGNWSKPNSDKLTAFSIHEEPIEFSDETEIVAKSIKEKNKKLNYEVDVEYPQVAGAAAARFEKFNQEARGLMSKRVAEFKKDMADRSTAEENPTDSESAGSDLGGGYSVGIARDNLISVQFDMGGYYQGAAHPNSNSEVINYDAKNGKLLKLSDLFKPGAKYLQAISSYVVKDLTKQSKEQGADSMLTPETINSGAGPDAKNFRSWTITKRGLALTFDSYQVAPYAAGPQEVLIPYSALKDIINPEGPLADFVK